MRNFRVLVKQLIYGNEIQFHRKIFTGDFFVKNFFKGIPYKNEPRSNVKGIPLYSCQGGQKKKSRGFLCKMNSDGI